METTDALSRPRAEAPALNHVAGLTRHLSSAFPLTWETAVVGMLFVVTLVTRLWALGARVMSHDESLHVRRSTG